MPQVRVLGVAQDSGGKWTGLYDGLAAHFEIVDVIRPVLTRPLFALLAARTVHPSVTAWKLRIDYSRLHFAGRTFVVERALRRHVGDYDVIVQTQTLNAPGGRSRSAPYVLYTDSTQALNERYRFGGLPTTLTRLRALQDRERRVFTGASHVFTMSEFARGSAISDYGCDPARVTAVGAGANLDIVAAPPPRPDRPRALLVGLELERKGGHEVLAAWPAVRAAVPDAELVIVGPPPGPDASGVRWTGRVESRAELAALYASATVFVLPTLWDPWGLVYHEAMANGLPCIGTDAFAVPEIIDDGVTGRLVPPRDPGAVADALIELLGDPDRAAAMGAEALRRVREDASWAAVAAKMAPGIEAVAR